MPLRNLKPEDRALITDSWLKSYRGASSARRVPDDVYFPRMRQKIQTRFAMGYFKILNAPDNADVIQGWSCYEGGYGKNTALHYVYVAPPYRGLHLARSLLPDNLAYYSHFTLAARPLLQALGCRWDKDGRPLPGGLRYDPFAW